MRRLLHARENQQTMKTTYNGVAVPANGKGIEFADGVFRVPDHPVTAMLLGELGEPVMSSTLLLPGEELPRTDAKDIYEKLEHSVDLVLDGGNCGLIPTSVVDLSSDRAIVTRVGRGDVSPFADSATV